MKIYAVTLSTPSLAVTPLGDRYYKLSNDTIVYVHTPEGCLTFSFKSGFVTNFRSGGRLVDGFIDQIGDEHKAIIYLLHDAAYTPCASCNGEHPLSRAMADELLRDGLAWTGMSKFKRNLVYYSVRAFGRRAYEEDDHLTETNKELFSFTWSAREAV